MSVDSVNTDYENLTITVVADFDAQIERVWELWSDPRKLERWWGPPGYPASFEKHDLTPGAEVTWFLTGPDGDRTWANWRIVSVDPPTSLEFTDAFADPDGKPAADAEVIAVSVRLVERRGGTRMEVRAKFESREAMERMLKMGMAEGLKQSVSQMDRVLA